jgi:uncharacterized membrane protein
MHAEILVLRVVHILSGIFWMGSGVFISFFLMPALAQSAPMAGQVMAALQQRRLFTALPIAAVLTIVSGLRLMWIMSLEFSRVYFATSMGHVLASAGGAAIVAFLIALFVARPAGMRVVTLAGLLANAASLSESERRRIGVEMDAARRRGAAANMTAVALLVLSATGMAVARYM